MTKRLAVFVAAFALGLTVLFVGASIAPSAVTEAVKAPIVTQDECLCGGAVIFLGAQWVEGHWVCYYSVNGNLVIRNC